jgi:hypothetical protein
VGVILEAFGPSTSSSVLLHHTATRPSTLNPNYMNEPQLI